MLMVLFCYGVGPCFYLAVLVVYAEGKIALTIFHELLLRHSLRRFNMLTFLGVEPTPISASVIMGPPR
jgi:hypothetical protein